MKKLLTTLLLFAALNGYSQSATMQVASVTKEVRDTAAPKLFYLIMPEKNWAELMALIKTADEKPSKIKEWEQLLIANLRLYEEPKKNK